MLLLQTVSYTHLMTVFDNIAFGLQVQKKSKKEIKERVTEMIELVGLKGMENRYPNALSGGQDVYKRQAQGKYTLKISYSNTCVLILRIEFEIHQNQEQFYDIYNSLQYPIAFRNMKL